MFVNTAEPFQKQEQELKMQSGEQLFVAYCLHNRGLKSPAAPSRGWGDIMIAVNSFFLWGGEQGGVALVTNKMCRRDLGILLRALAFVHPIVAAALPARDSLTL